MKFGYGLKQNVDETTHTFVTTIFLDEQIIQGFVWSDIHGHCNEKIKSV
jgi:hypothetical protein